ncbi:MAG: tetratricopeptide repeat protein [Planctomycetes bacterium]|nr:tetratricopeptide repeat protein [Planctomycetota bacterium]
MNRFLPLCVFIVASALFPALAVGIGDDTQKYRADLNEGIALIREGSHDDLIRAIAKFKAALKLRPESAEAYYWIALTYSDLNNYPRAADNAKDATIYDDRLAEAWLLWGQVLLYQKDWDEALKKLETASRLAPDDPLVLFNLGRVYYHGLKDPGAAYSRFNRVWQSGQTLRRENPENALLVLRARLYMGYCEFDRGQWTNAANAFQDVLREQPNNYDAALRLALTYAKSDRHGEAERILQSLLSIPRDSAINRQLLTETNLQLADLYLKSPALRNRLFALTHLREFVNLIGDITHPALEPVREYLAQHDIPEY